MNIYIYIKQHTITKLKYIGRTVRDPLKYNGSGIHWKRHLKKHGTVHVITLDIWKFDNQEECTSFALEFSKANNIVESDEWANMILEDGLHKSGLEKISSNNKNKSYEEIYGQYKATEIRNKISLAHKGKIKSSEHIKNISKSRTGKKLSIDTKEKIRIASTGRKHSLESLNKISQGNKGKHKPGAENMLRYRQKIIDQNLEFPYSKTWEVTYPNGDKKIIINLTKFCKEHNLSPGNFSTYGKAKGYTAKKLN